MCPAPFLAARDCIFPVWICCFVVSTAATIATPLSASEHANLYRLFLFLKNMQLSERWIQEPDWHGACSGYPMDIRLHDLKIKKHFHRWLPTVASDVMLPGGRIGLGRPKPAAAQAKRDGEWGSTGHCSA
jgi:hypothetical protein